ERLHDKTTRTDNARLRAHLYCLSLDNFRSKCFFLQIVSGMSHHSLLVYANESVLQQKVRISRCGNGVERIYGRVLPTEFHKITSPERIFDHTVSLCKAWILDIKYSTPKNPIAQQYSEVNGTFISLTMNRNAHYIQVLTIHQPTFCTTRSFCTRTDNYLSVIIKAPSASGTRLSVVVQTVRIRSATSARFLREALLLLIREKFVRTARQPVAMPFTRG
ncbi:hypothetical protein ALC57_16758, partial [Trachymyrmex cornetzi]